MPLQWPTSLRHFQIEAGALLQPLSLDQLAHAHQLAKPRAQLFLDEFHRVEHLARAASRSGCWGKR